MFSQCRRIELLLTELRYERHVRRALLSELIDELEDFVPQMRKAAAAGRGLLLRVDAGINHEEFGREVDRIAALAGLDAPHAIAG